jgi:hypothetical protein
VLHTLWSIDVSKVNGPVEKFGPQTGNFLGWRPRAQQKGYSKFSMDLGNSGPDGLSPLLFLYGLLPPNSAISKLFLFFQNFENMLGINFASRTTTILGSS